MISSGQEDLVRAYIDTFSCSITNEDGTVSSLNPDIEHFLEVNSIQFAKMKTAITSPTPEQTAGDTSTGSELSRISPLAKYILMNGLQRD